MTIRVHALWGREVWVARVLGFFLTGVTVNSIAFTIYHSIQIARAYALKNSYFWPVSIPSHTSFRLFAAHVIVANDVRTCLPGQSLPSDYFVVWIPAVSIL